MARFSITKKRTIKEVDSWDGSAANYSTAKEYADASLMNFNPSVGKSNPDEWTKDLIKLPVREAGDAKSVYVKQAVQAAVGGRGITQVTKPAGVSQEEFNRQLKRAANELIKAYREWGEFAPESVYKIAGKDRPEERMTSSVLDKIDNMYSMVEAVVDAIQLADVAENKVTLLVDIYYEDTTDRYFALTMRDGKFHTIELSIDDDLIILGDMEEVSIDNIYTEDRKDRGLSVYRTKNDELRWVSISNVATLNRVGEIDSTRLFDSFIVFTELTGIYPDVTVYHLGERSIVGKADFMARDGYVYITSGILFNDEIGRAIFRTLQNDTDGIWGDSIEFLSLSSHTETFEIGETRTPINIRIHDIGINTGVSIVMEADAASINTAHISRGGYDMPEALNAKLLQLFDGDEDAASAFLDRVSAANAEAQNRISRTTEVVEEEVVVDVTEEEEEILESVEVESEEEVEEEVEEEEVSVTETEVVLDESFVDDLVDSEAFRTALRSLLNAELAQLTNRLSALEREAEETRQYIDDSPVVAPAMQKNRTNVVYRPRNVEAESGNNNQQVSYVDKANSTLAAIRGGK